MLKKLLFGEPKRHLPLQIDITNACNLRCKHCYHAHHKNDGAIGLEDWKNILNQYRALIKKLNYKPMVQICGGEPTLSPLLPKIISYLLEWGDEKPEVVILTNGTLTSKLDWELLEKYQDILFQVSLDGPDAKRHNIIRGPGSFEKAALGIQTLKKKGFGVITLATLSKRTSPWIEDFFKLSQNLGLDGVGFTRLIVEGQAENMVSSDEDRPLEPLELKEAYEQILFCSAKYEVKTRYSNPLFHLIHKNVGANGKFFEGVIVNYQGYILASSRVDLKLGHALKDGIEKIYFQNQILKDLRQRKIEGCGTCKDFSVCGGDRNAAFAHSGNFLGKDPGCWKHLQPQVS